MILLNKQMGTSLIRSSHGDIQESLLIHFFQ